MSLSFREIRGETYKQIYKHTLTKSSTRAWKPKWKYYYSNN